MPFSHSKAQPKVSLTQCPELYFGTRFSCGILNFVAISVVNSFHPSATQNGAAILHVEDDVEKRLQSLVVKDRIRVKEFFTDFDKLRKGWVGEAAVSFFSVTLSVQNMP